MLKKEHEILLPFVSKPWRKLTFREIKDASRKSSESYVFNTLKKFSKEGVLKEEKAGNVVLYSLNLGAFKATSCAGFVAEYACMSRKSLPLNNIEKLAEKVPAAFFVMLITGSYATGSQRPDSDLDVVLICEDCADTKKVHSEIRYECDLSIPPMHPFVFTMREFLKMLADRKHNYGKEAARNNLIFAGGEQYFRMMGEAVKNGFNG